MTDASKPMRGTWKLVRPDGRTYHAPSPLACLRDEQGERIPPQVALQRIFDAASEDHDWQPIDTAPRDGTRVILSWGGKSINGFYLDNSRTATPWAGWRVESMVAQPPGKPTHWQPFPAPYGKTRAGWWCPHCQCEVPPVHVTYEETHDLREGGCGARLTERTFTAAEPISPASIAGSAGDGVKRYWCNKCGNARAEAAKHSRPDGSACGYLAVVVGREDEAARIRSALEAPGAERLRDFYLTGPVQRASVESFVDALASLGVSHPDPASSPEAAREFLKECGILTPDGKRSPNFYPDDPDGVKVDDPAQELLAAAESLLAYADAVDSDGHADPRTAAPSGSCDTGWITTSTFRPTKSTPPLMPPPPRRSRAIPLPPRKNRMPDALLQAASLRERDMAMMIRMLCSHTANDGTRKRAMELLCKHGLQGSPLRAALPAQHEDDIEAMIACLGDDAAGLRDENPEDERAANMDVAAETIRSLCRQLDEARPAANGVRTDAPVDWAGWIDELCEVLSPLSHGTGELAQRAAGLGQFMPKLRVALAAAAASPNAPTALLQQALEALELSAPFPGNEARWSAAINAIYAHMAEQAAPQEDGKC